MQLDSRNPHTKTLKKAYTRHKFIFGSLHFIFIRPSLCRMCRVTCVYMSLNLLAYKIMQLLLCLRQWQQPQHLVLAMSFARPIATTLTDQEGQPVPTLLPRTPSQPWPSLKLRVSRLCRLLALKLGTILEKNKVSLLTRTEVLHLNIILKMEHQL